ATVHDELGLAGENVAQDDRRFRIALVLALLGHDRAAVRIPLRAVAMASSRGRPAAMAASTMSAVASPSPRQPVPTISANRHAPQNAMALRSPSCAVATRRSSCRRRRSSGMTRRDGGGGALGLSWASSQAGQGASGPSHSTGRPAAGYQMA